MKPTARSSRNSDSVFTRNEPLESPDPSARFRDTISKSCKGFEIAIVAKRDDPMKNPDRFSSLVFFALGMMTALWSLKYGFGSLSEPGVGFITFFAGAILALLAALLFFSSLREKTTPAGLRALWAGLDVKKVIYVLGLLVAYTVLLRTAGFLLCTFILLFLLFRVKGSYGIWTTLGIGFFVTDVSYLVFQVWLQVQLPRGILG